MLAKGKLGKYANYALYALFAVMVLQRAPVWWKHFRTEGTKIPEITLPLIDGGTYNSGEDSRSRALVFWATWCGPCTVELRRIQNLIDAGQISAESVIAISSHEEEYFLRSAVRERGYTFPVGIDLDGEAMQRLQVSATPTIILKSGNGTIDWMTTGLSPFLEWRIKRSFSQENR